MLRESVFNICQNEIEGARFLDLFAGSGAMGLEALSRGASHATLVEKDRRAVALIRENIALLQLALQTTVVPLDAAQAIKRLHGPFEIIYVDPPYNKPASTYVESLLNLKLLAPNGILFIEERSGPNRVSPEFATLSLTGSRRFGEALLHQFRNRAQS
jgi:16S rRNA (guanine(966)-N(2))-methyltransferase RsmD